MINTLRTGITFLCVIIVLASISTLQAQNPKVEIKTSMGSILVELYPKKAPFTCNNFVRYVETNRYDTASFYRVVRMNNQPDNEIKIQVIQGGLGFDRLDSGYPPIQHETTRTTGLLHKDGTLSMARAEPGTASSEFFICIGDQPDLDYGGQRNQDGQGFAAFGQIVEGMDVVRSIQNQKDNAQMLVEEIAITSISIQD